MIVWRILSVCLALVLFAPAYASQINKSSGLGLSRSGPKTASGSVKPTGGDFGALLDKPAKIDGGGTDFSRLLDMPFRLPDIPADKATVKGVLTPKEIAKALRGGVGGYIAGEAFKKLAEQACVRLAGGSMQAIPSGAWEECVPGVPPPQSDGLEYALGSGANDSGWHSSQDSACQAFVGAVNGSQTTYTYSYLSVAGARCHYKVVVRANGSVQSADASQAFRTRNSTCPAGWYLTSTGCQQTKPEQPQEYTPVSTERAQQKLEDAIKLPANAQKAWDAMRDYADKGGQFDMDSPLSVTGPAQSPTSTTTSESTQQTSTGSQTLITTNTTVINYTYAGDTVTVNQITNSVTRNQAGDVVSSSTTQGAPEAVDEPPTDTPLPPVPDLYVRKYPNGMVGIYDEYKDQLKNTSLVQLSKQLMPNVGDGGTCPSWPINLNWDWWIMYGVYDVAPPCWIWAVGKAILILSALLLARALIFGG